MADPPRAKCSRADDNSERTGSGASTYPATHECYGSPRWDGVPRFSPVWSPWLSLRSPAGDGAPPSPCPSAWPRLPLIPGSRESARDSSPRGDLDSRRVRPSHRRPLPPGPPSRRLASRPRSLAGGPAAAGPDAARVPAGTARRPRRGAAVRGAGRVQSEWAGGCRHPVGASLHCGLEPVVGRCRFQLRGGAGAPRRRRCARSPRGRQLRGLRRISPTCDPVRHDGRALGREPAICPATRGVQPLEAARPSRGPRRRQRGSEAPRGRSDGGSSRGPETIREPSSRSWAPRDAWCSPWS